MLCRECGAVIDPETDRHMGVVERIVAPEWGVEGAEGGVHCAECMEPRVAKLESLALR